MTAPLDDIAALRRENARLTARLHEYIKDVCELEEDKSRLTAERDECRARLGDLSAAANQPALIVDDDRFDVLDDRLEALESRMAGSLAELHSTLSARLDALEAAR